MKCPKCDSDSLSYKNASCSEYTGRMLKTAEAVSGVLETICEKLCDKDLSYIFGGPEKQPIMDYHKFPVNYGDLICNDCNYCGCYYSFMSDKARDFIDRYKEMKEMFEALE